MENKKFKAGDLVRRVRGGPHGRIKEGESFIIERMDGTCVRDDLGWGHDPENLELVSSAETITNTYELW